jgi:Glycosyl transferase family 2
LDPELHHGRQGKPGCASGDGEASVSKREAAVPPVTIAVLAHNEERRIARCLRSLPLADPDVAVHVVVNGSSDQTAEIAREIAAPHPNVRVHVYEEGGKARSWNQLVFGDLSGFSETHVFVDGDAEIAAGSVPALVRALAQHPGANASSGLPLNGRNAASYRSEVEAVGGLFGDLYAVRGTFLDRMKQRGLRLPRDVVGDDGLIASLAKTDLAGLEDWDDRRVAPCRAAGFYCEETSLARPRTLRTQYRRMINYSVRHFQNRIISHILDVAGPEQLPDRLADLYGEWLPRFAPRREPAYWWFDRIALKRMARAAGM